MIGEKDERDCESLSRKELNAIGQPTRCLFCDADDEPFEAHGKMWHADVDSGVAPCTNKKFN